MAPWGDSSLKSHCSNLDQYPLQLVTTLSLGSSLTVCLPGDWTLYHPVQTILSPVFSVTYSSFVGASSSRASLKRYIVCERWGFWDLEYLKNVIITDLIITDSVLFIFYTSPMFLITKSLLLFFKCFLLIVSCSCFMAANSFVSLYSW